jgi:transcriptional regulator with XRE-family HTH domain
MKASQSHIARIEGGKVRPSTDALERFAQATGTPENRLKPQRTR